MSQSINDTTSMFYGASAILFARAKQLRKNETAAERELWSRLSNKKLGVKFTRQHPIYKFIADFYCHQYQLVVELDGGVHNSAEAKEYDEIRTHAMNHWDIEVIRFKNKEVFNNIEEVLQKIQSKITQKKGPPKKSPLQGIRG
jgi:very-short-patch-repair endonuclease